MKISNSRPSLKDVDISVISDIIKGGKLSEGEYVKKFEKYISNYIGNKYSIAVNSGTSALEILIDFYNWGDDDAIIVPTFTYLSTVSCFVNKGIYPVFVDINEYDYTISIKEVLRIVNEECVFEKGLLSLKKNGKKVVAILGVHIYGIPIDFEAIVEICNKYYLTFIEDSAEALGSAKNGIKCGNIGDSSIFGFFPNKQITTGEGGVITTNNEKLYKFALNSRCNGKGESFYNGSDICLGHNYKMPEISAYLGLSQIQKIDTIIYERNKIMTIYDNILGGKNNFKILKLFDKSLYLSRFCYPVEILSECNKNDLILYMREKGIEIKSYFKPLHLDVYMKQKFFYKEGDFPVSELIYKRIIILPVYLGMKEKEINYVCDNLFNFLKIGK